MKNLIQYENISRTWQGIIAIAIWCIAVCSMMSCRGMTNDYKKYLEEGEIVYPAKADSIEVHPGKNRIELQWLLLSDPSVTSSIVYWNAKHNSKIVAISRTPGVVDTIKVTLDNLEEGTYTFEVYTFNADGVKSVAAEVTGIVYGDRYEASLLSESYSLHYDAEKGGFIIWNSEIDNVEGNKVYYTTNEGSEATVFVNKGDSAFALPDFDHVSPVTYRTAYLPPMAIDTFYAGFSPIDLNDSANVPAWKLVWADEFDYNGLPDPDKWGYVVGRHGNEPQWYTCERLENARVSDGVLTIEARKEAAPVNAPVTQNAVRVTGFNPNPPAEQPQYASVCLVTSGRASWCYGRMEMRAKMPLGKGTWPAFWTLANDYAHTGGEIDIVECYGNYPGQYSGALHWQENGQSKYVSKWMTAPNKDLDKFHTYAVEWTPDKIDFFFDNKKYYSVPVSNFDAEGYNVFRNPHFILLNLAFEGPDGAGNPRFEGQGLPQQMVVDYVRVYEYLKFFY